MCYLLTTWSIVLEKLTGSQLVKKSPTFYGTWRFITTFKSACYPSLSPARSTQSLPLHPTSWRSILMLSSRLCPGLPDGLFPSHFPTKAFICLSSPPICATVPPISFLDLITWTVLGVEYSSLSSSLCSFLHYRFISSLLDPYILINTLFSNTLSLHSSLNVSNQVSHLYTKTGKILVLSILIFQLLDRKLEDRRFCTECKQAFPDFMLLLISSWVEFWFVKVVAKYLNSSTFSKELLSIFILWLRPESWSQDMTMFLVLTAFTSRPISLLPFNKASVFFFIVCVLPPNILTSSA